jgi:hypothetical protein
VHDSKYALSKRVEIPEGSYGAGVTKLDWARKAELKQGQDYFTLTTKQGEKYLLKHVPKYEDGKGWLFKNLTKKEDEPVKNKYIKQIEKEASLLAGGAIGHLAQNAATRFALKSKKTARHLADHFATGMEGRTRSGKWNAVKDAVIGAVSPDFAIAGRSLNNLGHKIHELNPNLTKRDRVGLRMLSQGRFSDIQKYKMHERPAIKSVIHEVGKSQGIDLSHVLDSEPVKKLEQVWHDPSHPLLSNIASNLSRGKVFTQSRVGHPNATGGVLGGAAMAAVEPGSGALTLAKHVSSSKTFNNTSWGKKLTQKIEHMMVNEPAKKGWEEAGKFVDGVKSKAYEHIISPTTAHLRRTSAAISSALKSTNQ